MPYHADRRPTRAPNNNIHCRGVADDLPDALPLMLAVDEEALAARGQDGDAEASEFAVGSVVGGPARPQRFDAGVGEDDPWA